ncbi:Nmad2 family putative nucleotide modification protein [Achromobacter xylosoxidans]|uniref:Nmad2 family putative nucleotide modification protein n=1 Tax=Alcaligenes xylosoxydans xylosoxydans TaxID=85698 RepID=UPI0038FD2E10
MARIYSYVVRYDSGFAPNPFYGYCTLATCKPSIRRSASVGDWVVGSGSNDRTIRRGGHLVYAMRVTDTLTFDGYGVDPRFGPKTPFRNGSRKQSCGDNIYFRSAPEAPWQQRDSFHSLPNGSLNPDHVRRDTGVNRVLISDDFVYFGGEGPEFPDDLKDQQGRPLCKTGIGLTTFDDPLLVAGLEQWIRSLGATGYQGAPFEWLTLRG